MDNFNHFRYVIVILLVIGLFILANIEQHLPLTLLELTTDYDISKVENSFQLLSLGRGIQAFQWTSYVSLLLFANLILKWDSKVMLAFGFGGMSLCHLLVPVTLPLNRGLFIIICILQGFFHGMIFPFFLTIMSFWTPIMENTTLISISMFGYYLAMSLNGTIFFNSTNSDVSFYIFGAIGLCWTILWSILAKAKPPDEPKITQTELKYILSNGNERGITTLTSSIRKQIFKTRSTLSIFLVLLCNVFNFGIVAFMVAIIGSNKVLDDTILYSYLVAAFVIVAIAYITDYLRQKCSITKIRKTVICTGLLCSAIMMPFIGIYYPKNPIFYWSLLGSFIVFQAIIQTSCFVNLVDVVNHAAGYALGVFLGITSLIAAGILLITMLVSLFGLPNGHVIFWLVTALNAVGSLIYAICGLAKREIWAMNQAGTRTETSIALKETSNESATSSNV